MFKNTPTKEELETEFLQSRDGIQTIAELNELNNSEYIKHKRKQEEKQKNIQNIKKEIDTEENHLEQFKNEKTLFINKEIEKAFEENFMSLLDLNSSRDNMFNYKSITSEEEQLKVNEFIQYYRDYGYSRFRPTGLTIKKICLNKKYENICKNIHKYMIDIYTKINKPKFEAKYNAEIERREKNIKTKIKKLQDISIPEQDDQDIYTDTIPEQDTNQDTIPEQDANQDTIPEQDAIMDPQISELLKTLKKPPSIQGGKKRRRKTRKTK